jgi:hypothetical protein
MDIIGNDRISKNTIELSKWQKSKFDGLSWWSACILVPN